jgi:hypothetical protein
MCPGNGLQDIYFPPITQANGRSPASSSTVAIEKQNPQSSFAANRPNRSSRRFGDSLGRKVAYGDLCLPVESDSSNLDEG